MSEFTPQLFGPFFLLEVLGTGGMAEVFLAVPTEGPRTEPFALKRPLGRFSLQPEFVARFTTEAKVSALLHHPNIVDVKDLGAVGTDLYLTMEWIQGVSLARLLSALREAGKKLPPELRSWIFLGLASALDHAHDAQDSVGRSLGIVHRDVTPSNVLLGFDGTVKLSDFGIATAERGAAKEPRDSALGKLSYMAPEQLVRGPIDRRTDLYSFGVMLYESVTLIPPFEARHQIELQEMILHEPPSFREENFQSLPELVDQLRKFLAKSPDERPTSCAEVVRALFPIDKERGRDLLRQILSDYFAEERDARAARITSAMHSIPAKTEDALDELDRLLEDDSPPEGGAVPPREKTEWMAHENLEAEKTRIVSKRAESLGRVGLLKIPVSVTIPSPPAVEEVTPPPTPVVEAPSLPTIALDDFDRPPSSERLHWIDPTEEHVSPFLPTLLRHLLPPLLLTFALLAGVIYAVRWWRTPAPGLAAPIQSVEIWISLEGPVPEDQRKDLGRWLLPNDRYKVWISPLEKFFVREYRRITGKATVPFRIAFSDPQIEVPPIRWDASILDPFRPFRESTRLHNFREAVLGPGVGRLFLRAYPKRPEEAPRYPLDHRGDRPRAQGIVYIPLKYSMADESLVRIAHEIGHLLGASDKYSDRGLALVPNGLADPSQRPLYPQKLGELMTRGIPDTETTQVPIRSLKETRIGLQTATEIGWK